ncbi:MAG: phosphatidylglycerophosphatase A, partial [Planktomarina sp.]
MINLMVTFFFVGRLKPAPGTWGSLAAILIGYVLIIVIPPVMFALAICLVFFGGWYATHLATMDQVDHDPGYIVIDEVAGQWVAILPLAFIGPDPIAAAIAFVAFRAFDILKPGPIGWADRRGDAFGVMFDDVIAGAFAAVFVF